MDSRTRAPMSAIQNPARATKANGGRRKSGKASASAIPANAERPRRHKEIRDGDSDEWRSSGCDLLAESWGCRFFCTVRVWPDTLALYDGLEALHLKFIASNVGGVGIAIRADLDAVEMVGGSCGRIENECGEFLLLKGLG